MSDEIENRRFKRFNVDGIHGNMIFSSDINIVNISIDGAAIQTTKRLNLDREYNLKIKYRDTLLNLRGIVVWSVLSHTETKKGGEVVPVYKAGLRFTNVLNDQSQGLLRFIDENRTESIERRTIGVRFKIKKGEDALLDVPCDYHIKRMSLSGMLIETEHFLKIDSLHEMEMKVGDTLISVVGRIVNCVEVRTDTAMQYDIGIEFIRMSDGDRIFLKEFLEGLEQG